MGTRTHNRTRYPHFNAAGVDGQCHALNSSTLMRLRVYVCVGAKNALSALLLLLWCLVYVCAVCELWSAGHSNALCNAQLAYAKMLAAFSKQQQWRGK